MARKYEIHGGARTRLYNTWRNMRGRCSNPNNPSFRRYGGKGIKVCPEWGSFGVFRDWAKSHGYADDLTIDRIDSTGNYEPDNCQWITGSENSRRAHIGENNHLAHLTEADIRAIRKDGRTQVAIAADYGVSQAQVSNIKRREQWGHVT